jgi:hypothetical protein
MCAEPCSPFFDHWYLDHDPVLITSFLRNPLLKALRSSIGSRTPNPQSLRLRVTQFPLYSSLPYFRLFTMSVPYWFYFAQVDIPPDPYTDKPKTVVISVSKVPTQLNQTIANQYNSSSDQNRNTTTNSVPVSIADIQTQSPSDSPLGTKNLFPDFDHKDTLARIVKIEDRLETIENQMTQILSILQSSLPKVPLPETPISAPLSETPPTPEKSQPSSPVPIAWNGINSQIKIAASSTTPVKPTTSPSVKPTNNPSPKASDPLKASDPPPRPKVIPARTKTSTCSNVCPRRATTLPHLIHNLRRVLEGEPPLYIIPDSRRSAASRSS